MRSERTGVERLRAGLRTRERADGVARGGCVQRAVAAWQRLVSYGTSQPLDVLSIPSPTAPHAKEWLSAWLSPLSSHLSHVDVCQACAPPRVHHRLQWHLQLVVCLALCTA